MPIVADAGVVMPEQAPGGLLRSLAIVKQPECGILQVAPVAPAINSISILAEALGDLSDCNPFGRPNFVECRWQRHVQGVQALAVRF